MPAARLAPKPDSMELAPVLCLEDHSAMRDVVAGTTMAVRCYDMSQSTGDANVRSSMHGATLHYTQSATGVGGPQKRGAQVLRVEDVQRATRCGVFQEH